MHPAATDTLTCDTARLARWWTDPAYDYERALHAAEGTWWDRLRSWLDWKLSEWFDWTLTDSEVNWVFVAAALVVLLLIVAYLWWKHPGLFRRVGRAGKSSAATDEDTIYGIDFPEEIRRATSREDYTAAVRYTYLYMLRQLDDAGLIRWQSYKTPTDYVYELREADSAEDLRALTNGFLRVRYGNYTATRAFYDGMCRSRDALVRRLLHTEGGEP